MSSRALTVWAVSATVIAVAAGSALGYTLGQRSAPEPAVVAPGNPNAATTDPARGGQTQPVYVVPDVFADVPTEWRTAVGRKPQAYAALFDPVRRELIVEHCQHPGYDVADEDALSRAADICTLALRARIAQLADDRAIAIGRDGDPVEVRIDAALDEQPPRLRLRFGEHDVDMLPGSKNTMFQALEAMPAIAQQKSDFLRAQMAATQSRRPAVTPEQEGQRTD